MVRLPAPVRPLFPVLKPLYSRATGLVAPVTTRISSRRGGWLPTGVADTVEDAAARSGGRCVVARGAQTLVRPPMQGVPADLPLSDDTDGDHVPRVAVAEFPHGRVAGSPHRAVVTGTGLLVDEVSRWFGTTRPRQHPLHLSPGLGAPTEVGGRLGVLATRADANYYHFLVDGLTRLDTLRRADGIAPVDRWYAPATTRFQREVLDLVGLTDRIVDADRVPHVRAEVLVVPGPPAMDEKNPPWVVEVLRELLLPHAAPGPGARRVYVTRGASSHNRAIVDEGAVVDRLARRGFVAVEPGAMSVAEQVRTFADAEFVVAAHGAALTNLAFASPGASVVEIFPAGSLLPDFFRLACGVPGLTHRYLSAPVAGRRRPTRATTLVRDIEVDLPALDALLDELGA